MLSTVVRTVYYAIRDTRVLLYPAVGGLPLVLYTEGKQILGEMWRRPLLLLEGRKKWGWPCGVPLRTTSAPKMEAKGVVVGATTKKCSPVPHHHTHSLSEPHARKYCKCGCVMLSKGCDICNSILMIACAREGCGDLCTLRASVSVSVIQAGAVASVGGGVEGFRFPSPNAVHQLVRKK